MVSQFAIAALALSGAALLAQTPASQPTPRPKFDAFEVATIKPVEQDAKAGRYLIMQGDNRFRLTFHREQKDFSIYELQVAKGGPKLKPSTAADDEQPQLISTVYPQRIVLPARNVSMSDLAILMQRAMLDRPVVDKTNLPGRFDFDLEWAPDETQFGGEVPIASADAPSPPLFSALQQQLGLKLEATRGPIESLVVDKVERPSAN